MRHLNIGSRFSNRTGYFARVIGAGWRNAVGGECPCYRAYSTGAPMVLETGINLQLVQ
jgi:hypothetical protein